MQTAIFDMLADVDRLYSWTTAEDLIKCVGELP